MRYASLTSIILVISVVCILPNTYGQSSKSKVPQAASGVPTLSERVQNLLDMNVKKPVLRFNANKFKDFVKTAPRNYSMIVMFTALSPARQCVICRHAHDEFTIAANSYRYSQSYSNRLFFAMVDFDDGKDVFQMLRLNSAPVFMHFPAKGKPKGVDTMEVQRVGFSAEAIARWVQERTDIQIRVFRPPNYFGTIATLVLVVFVGGLLYVRRNNLDMLYNKKFWSIGALVFTFAMISGQMWNHIRGPPFLHKTQGGQISYFHGSSHGQLVVESYIIMFLNAMIVLGMVLLTEAGSQGDTKRSKMTAIIGLSLLVVFFSLLLSVFRSKAQGYPYSLFFV